jgi:hypothetical protein
MPRTIPATSACLALTAVLVLSGCGKTPPRVTEVEGTVLLDDKPLPNAQVQFVPELSNFGAEMNSTGVTDDKGRFTLTCAYQSQPGAVVGSHRVVVTDAPVPRELRGQTREAQEKLARYQAGLKNRPIPAVYGSVGQTPLRLEVKADQKTYAVNLTRKP